MYEVRNAKNETVSQDMVLSVAKGRAESFAKLDEDYNKKNPHGPFSVYRVEQVWTTQTLGEALQQK